MFGPLRYGRLLAGAAGRPAGVRRHPRSPLPREVPDAVVSAGGPDGSGGVVGRESVASDAAEFHHPMTDLRDLIARGLSDGEITARLELSDPAIVGAFRLTLDELQLADR